MAFKITTEYISWFNMKQRCQNPKHPRFKDWGARGIRVCDRWQTFSNFFEDMGKKPSKTHSIDRINNDGNYEPTNCRWATKSEQSKNRKYKKWSDLPSGISRHRGGFQVYHGKQYIGFSKNLETAKGLLNGIYALRPQA